MTGLLSMTQHTNSLAIFSKVCQIKEDAQRACYKPNLIFTQALNFFGENCFRAWHISSTVAS